MKPHMKSPTEIAADDHIQGKRDAPIVLLEYGDYECPYCGAAYPVTKELQNALGENLCFVFRNFPLRTAHPHAEKAAEAAEAAGARHKFWEMHDILFENQENLEDEDLLEYAMEVGIKPDELRQDLLTERFYPRVQEDFISGLRGGVNGTPTFFINGMRHNGDFSYSTLWNAILEVSHLPAH
jgi:protein-disulfide isomerase